ncbi:hypothetical protein Q5762_10950 [Streptomyces sp. P9(2023)]|uniref:hypothetical protein n=1 Tax=Streptomyces sp. P9(2023) TaxID=3064394 RepID=UPI0028F417B3|nr:hypothetical protein [Streptomyces sp. P9(2023)]MDT9688865.1 hypothetical protein [Streptomyces sp. P9(2023)]
MSPEARSPRVQHELGDRVATAAEQHQNLWEQLRAGCRAFLAAGTDPAVRQILLVDAMTVLGWDEWRALDEESSARHLTDALTALAAAGTVAEQPVEPLARLLSGAMNEAALWIAGAGTLRPRSRRSTGSWLVCAPGRNPRANSQDRAVRRHWLAS